MRKLLILLGVAISMPMLVHADVTRYPLPNNSAFPISQAVEISSGNIIFLSGLTPRATNPQAERGTSEYYGDTRTQTISALNRMVANLEGMGLGMGDVVKLQVFLVGDPDLEGVMDFAGFMEGYTQFFGTEEQPNLPVRSAFQIARLGSPLMFIEIEATAVRK